MESGSTSTKMPLNVYSVYTSSSLEVLVHGATAKSFGVVFDDMFKFSVCISASAMTSSAANATRTRFATFFQEDNMSPDLCEVFLFVKYRSDAKRAGVDLFIK